MKSQLKQHVAIIIASSNFRDEEFLFPKNILENAGYKITIASSSIKEAVGMLGLKVTPHMLLKDVIVDDYDAIIFVGGGGAEEYFDNSEAHKIANEAYEKNKVLAAICIAPNILANAGLLRNKKATCYDSDNLIAKGAIVSSKPVEQDGKIITGKNPKAAKEFAETILSQIKQ